MQVLMLGAAIVILMIATAYAEPSATYRDASGRMTGTSSTNANGTTTFRDDSGRMTGTAERTGNGTIQFRDGSGRMTGTAIGPTLRDRR